jgi:hypothetical protein
MSFRREEADAPKQTVVSVTHHFLQCDKAYRTIPERVIEMEVEARLSLSQRTEDESWLS